MPPIEDDLAAAFERAASALREHARARDEGAEHRTVTHLYYALEQVDYCFAKFKDGQLQEGKS